MPGSPPAPPARTASQPTSWQKKTVFAAVITSGFFLIVEGALTLFGVDRASDLSDPFVGFEKRFPLMIVSTADDGTEIVSTAPNKLRWFNQQSFPLEKRDNVKRIFCLGGSTTYGRPYDDLTSYSGWLREILPIAAPDQEWEVINAGGVSYASYRVASVMEELARFQPDLFIVYSAHNEFLERRTYAGMFDQPSWKWLPQSLLMRTRTWSAVKTLTQPLRTVESSIDRDVLPGEVDEMLNHTIGPADYRRDPEWRRQVIRHYEINLRRMAEIAKRAGAGLVLIAPASNELDCSPFKSQLSDHLTAAQSRQFGLFFDRGQLELQAGEHQRALDQLLQAESIDRRHAELQYQIGRTLHVLQRHSDARIPLANAINEDVCPLRAVNEITQVIRLVSKELDVPLVDFESRLRSKSMAELGHDCLGGRYFLDHVHPTIDVHQDLAIWIVESMKQSQLIDAEVPTRDQLNAVDAKVRSQIDSQSHAVALRNLAKVLHWSGKFEEAMPRAIDALREMEDDLESRYILADCLVHQGRLHRAFRQYERLLAAGDFPRAYLPFAELLVIRGDYERAQDYLALASVYLGRKPAAARAQYLLGQILLDQQQFAAAAGALEQSHQILPDDWRTLNLLAEAEAGAGRSEAAIKHYRQALQLAPQTGELHNRLGLLYLKTADYDLAKREFESAVAANPNDDAAAANLEVVKRLTP